MADRLDGVEARLQRIEEALADVSRRMGALENGTAPALASVERRHTRVALAGRASGTDMAGAVSLAGRTFIVFGGAFLLRALTDSGRLPPMAGIAAGFAYAIGCVAAAQRARGLSGVLHGATALLIGLPLVWEASTRFQAIAPAASAAAVGILSCLVIGVAWHRRMPVLAAFSIAGMIVTTFALIGATGRPVPFAALLLTLCIVTAWLAVNRQWSWLQWPAALAVNAVAGSMVIRALASPPLDSPRGAMGVLLALAVSYLLLFGARTLVGRRSAGAFEWVQTSFVLAIGIGGGVAIARATGATGTLTAFGITTLCVAAASGALAFAAAPPNAANVVFYSTLAVGLAIAGSGVLWTGPALAFVLCALCVVTAGLSARFRLAWLWWHGTVLVAGAAWASALLSTTVTIWFTQFREWPSLPPAGWVVVLVSGLLLLTARRSHRLAAAVVCLIAASTAAITVVGPGFLDAPLNAGALSSFKTVTLALVAVVLALGSRIPRLTDAGVLVYPVLGLCAIKLCLEDLRISQPSSLFITLAVYGVALIAAPRIAKRP